MKDTTAWRQLNKHEQMHRLNKVLTLRTSNGEDETWVVLGRVSQKMFKYSGAEEISSLPVSKQHLLES